MFPGSKTIHYLNHSYSTVTLYNKISVEGNFRILRRNLSVRRPLSSLIWLSPTSGTPKRNVKKTLLQDEKTVSR